MILRSVIICMYIIRTLNTDEQLFIVFCLETLNSLKLQKWSRTGDLTKLTLHVWQGMPKIVWNATVKFPPWWMHIGSLSCFLEHSLIFSTKQIVVWNHLQCISMLRDIYLFNGLLIKRQRANRAAQAWKPNWIIEC